MRSAFSEFSYGFALIRELVEADLSGLTACPVLPSLYSEGQPGGGWDAMLESGGCRPWFVQFKLAERMVRRSCAESKAGVLTTPCFRMNLHPRQRSRQHDLLLELEASGLMVHYAAPCFSSAQALNESFSSRQVRNNSLWIQPRDIGSFAEAIQGHHHVSFVSPAEWYLFSTPKRGERQIHFGRVLKDLQLYLRDSEQAARTVEDDLGKIITILKKRSHGLLKAATPADKSTARTLETLAALAAVLLDCQLFLVRPKT